MARSNKKRKTGTEPKGLLLNIVKPRTINQDKYIDNIENNIITLCTGPAGSGKALKLSAKLFTKNGPILMRDVQIGDNIASNDGQFYNVSGIYPQGRKQVYRVTFNDGNYIDCCKDHLWEVDTISNGALNKIISTEDLYNNYLSISGRNKYCIRPTKSVSFDSKRLNIDPYLLGILLAEGCFRSSTITFTTSDEEIADEVYKRLPIDSKLTYLRKYLYSISKKQKDNTTTNLQKELIKYGLYNLTSVDKFIPNEYKYTSIENRLNLIQGMMDGDGTVDKISGMPIYNTSSERLANDFKEVIESLGGIVRITSKIAKYRKKGKIIECAKHYTIRINYHDNKSLFKLTRKQNLIQERNTYFPNRIITNVEKLDIYEEMQCITVDSPNHLFLTDNFIPTHNTFLAVGKACQMLANGQIDNIVICRSIIGCGKDIGILPGDVDEKIHAYMIPALEYLEYCFGNNVAIQKIREGIIKLMPVELIRGHTYNKSFIILEECQNVDIPQLKLFMSRIGRDSKMVLIGDNKQSDIGKYSCMPFLLSQFNNIDGMGVSELTYDDVLRHEIIPDILAIFDKNGY